MAAVVIGPGKAILFYGRRSMGEGLKVDKARDTTSLLTGAGTWVGKSAYLTANPMTYKRVKGHSTCCIGPHGESQRTGTSSSKPTSPTAFQV